MVRAREREGSSRIEIEIEIKWKEEKEGWMDGCKSREVSLLLSSFQFGG